MISVLVNGARGRMGREVVKAVTGQDDLRLVAQTDLGDDLRTAIRESRADVAVDFTVPSTVAANVRVILAEGARPVVGTTGLAAEDIAELQAQARARGLGGVIAPNFAVGAVLLMHYAAHAARFLPHVEIVELHHDRKLDAPSGTARMTAERIARARTPSGEHAETAAAPGFRGGLVEGVPVHSVRLPGLVAHEEVIFGAPGQTLTIRHDSLSRESFMPGVLLAIRAAPRLRELIVGLERLLELA
jgi:4-hydroxy-tetrahydrodipicolinate reductase